jgi:hypothetical protein
MHTYLQCLKLLTETPRVVATRACVTVTYHFDPFPLTPSPKLCIVDDPRNHPTTTSNQPLQVESNFGDSSGPLFSIYSKVAEEEDNKMVERWQKDADGILIFVSPILSFIYCIFSRQLVYYRLVYSLPQSLPSLLLPSRT